MPTRSNEGAKRAASASLWANGGFPVVLRMPGKAVSGSDAEELGLGIPQYDDLPIAPAAWKRAGNQQRLLLAAEAVAMQVSSGAFSSAEELLEAAAFVVVSGIAYVITGCDPVMVAGTPCAYLLSLEAPTWS